MNLYDIYVIIKRIQTTYTNIEFNSPLKINGRKALGFNIYSSVNSVDFQMDDSDGEDYEISLDYKELKKYNINLSAKSHRSFIWGVFEDDHFTI